MLTFLVICTHVVVVSHGNDNIERSMYKHMDIDR